MEVADQRPCTKDKKKRVGPLFEVAGGLLKMVFDILHKVTVSKKWTSSYFKSFYIGRYILKSYAKWYKNQDWKYIVIEI